MSEPVMLTKYILVPAKPEGGFTGKVRPHLARPIGIPPRKPPRRSYTEEKKVVVAFLTAPAQIECGVRIVDMMQHAQTLSVEAPAAYWPELEQQLQAVKGGPYFTHDPPTGN